MLPCLAFSKVFWDLSKNVFFPIVGGQGGCQLLSPSSPGKFIWQCLLNCWSLCLLLRLVCAVPRLLTWYHHSWFFLFILQFLFDKETPVCAKFMCFISLFKLSFKTITVTPSLCLRAVSQMSVVTCFSHHLFIFFSSLPPTPPPWTCWSGLSSGCDPSQPPAVELKRQGYWETHCLPC